MNRKFKVNRTQGRVCSDSSEPQGAPEASNCCEYIPNTHCDVVVFNESESDFGQTMFELCVAKTEME